MGLLQPIPSYMSSFDEEYIISWNIINYDNLSQNEAQPWNLKERRFSNLSNYVFEKNLNIQLLDSKAPNQDGVVIQTYWDWV